MKYSTQISNGRPFDEESIIVLLIRDGKCFIQLKELRPVVEGYWKIDGVDIQFGKLVNNFIAYKKFTFNKSKSNIHLQNIQQILNLTTNNHKTTIKNILIIL